MNNDKKIIIALIGSLLLICICMAIGGGILMWQAGQAIEEAIETSEVTDPEDVVAIARGIADYTLPPGYKETEAMQMFGMQIIMITSEDSEFSNAPVIMLMKVPAIFNMNEQDLQESFQEGIGTNDLNLQEVNQTTIVIRDQQVPFTIYEGSDKNGITIRQMTGIFEGKSAPTVLTIIGATNEWNQAEIDAFLSSIK